MCQKKLMNKISLLITTCMLLNSPIFGADFNRMGISSSPTTIYTAISDNFINDHQFISNELLLPRYLYVLKGDEGKSDKFNIYYRNIFSTLATTYSLTSSSQYGELIDGRYVMKTSDDSLPKEPFSLSFTATVNNESLTKSTTIEVVDKSNTTPVRLLAIGDSLTRAGVYLNRIQTLLPNVTCIGTRYYPNDGMPAREGRGGWRLEDYFSFKNIQSLDSPFMFPIGVSGMNYKGNTQDWKNICYDAPTYYIYNGFQKLARGWKDTGEFLYDENGYYKYPVVGDVMYDPTVGLEGTFVEWNGAVWVPMTNQPTEYAFNFTKYMDKNKAAFAEGGPTHISILLGANDFGLNHNIDKMEEFMTQLHTMIDSIHEYDPNIKVIICMPTLGPNPTTITSSNKFSYTQYTIYMKYAAARILESFDTDEALSQHVYLAPMTLSLDTNIGFTYVDKNETIDGITSNVVDVTNSIHPNNEYGQPQMGDTLAAVIQKTR